MNPFSRILFFMLAGICFSGIASGQGNTNPYQNRLIAKYYTPAELDYLQTNLPQKFNQVKFFYIYSFYVTALPCTGCPAANLSLVDVRDYESYRLPDQLVTINEPSKGYSITLISKRDLEQMINKANGPKERPKSVGGVKSNLFIYQRTARVYTVNKW